MSAEEEFAKAADAIKFDEIFFKKTEESLGNRPVYKQWKGDDWAERFLFYEGPKSMWKVGNSAAFGRPSLYTSPSGWMRLGVERLQCWRWTLMEFRTVCMGV